MPERVVHILSEQVASQIAAGEVVERPASAVKELAENSLDAGTHAITVEIEGGGTELIIVADDGCGMGREDAFLSLRRHATSKVRDVSDLAAIRSFGFRGEALASIASVAHLRMQTRRPTDQHGIELTAHAGEVEHVGACAIAPGTRIEVRKLFYNTPARLKFMKTAATEQSAVAEALQRLALANWRIAFRLIAGSRTLFELPRAASLLERLRHLYGARLAEQMLQFESRSGATHVHGLTSASQESFAAPRLVLTYVNRRLVRDRMLLRAIARAYETLLPRGRHPAVALFVDLPAEEVDVNVHPMKTEVRFRRSGNVFELVYSVLRERLRDQTADTVQGSAAEDAAEDAIEQPRAAGLGITLPIAAEVNSPSSRDSPGRSERPLRLVADTPLSRASQGALGLAFASRAGFHDLESRPAPPQVPRYSELRIVGQLFAGFIALEGSEGLILVDQHAAHERVTFERLRVEFRGGGIRVQPLLTPAPLELSPARAAQAMAAIPELRAMGFEVEPFGTAALLLKGAPAVFAAADGLRLLADVLDSMGDNGLRVGGEDALEEWLKTVACHGSVRAGRTLEVREMAALLDELDHTEFKTNCPHGRPVHIEFRRTQLERMFRR
jgi:DNA mismatch repair protein MutL